MTKSLNPQQIRNIIIDQSKRANVGHIGSALSVVEIIAALYSEILHTDALESQENRDIFILSKGHAALTLYTVLYLKGWLSFEELNSYHENGSLLGVHPEHRGKHIDFSTGSLGHGLSMGVGAALASRIKKSTKRVFVLLSDAECNEGSIWEAAMFAAHHHLSNLFAIVDVNGQQALGFTKEILCLAPLAKKWDAFGWNVADVDGHDTGEIVKRIKQFNHMPEAPNILLAHTIFGKGVSFMEGQLKWHYMPMSEEEYRQAKREIGGLP